MPEVDRKSGHKLKFDPTNKDHLILGGVFYQDKLSTAYNPKKVQQLWIWNMKEFSKTKPQDAEAKLLSIIVKIFQGELNQSSTIKTVGIGIGRSDLPSLFIKCQSHQIASDDELYRLFFSGFPIDLSLAGIGYVNSHPYGFEPVSTSNLFSSWGLENSKSSGSNVWKLYEQEQYHLIEDRTKKEVEGIVELYDILAREVEV